MHVYAEDTVVMKDLDIHGKGIGDEEIHASAPLVRALLVQRYEKLWAACEPQINGDNGKPDPRFIEAGIRVSERLARLYRLDQPIPPADPGPSDLVSPSQLAENRLRELEARIAEAVIG
jgi:hypothetical protein